jgi:hypothetical protein
MTCFQRECASCGANSHGEVVGVGGRGNEDGDFGDLELEYECTGCRRHTWSTQTFRLWIPHEEKQFYDGANDMLRRQLLARSGG